MIWFSAIGLLLDLIGVVLLGFDLIFVQKSQKSSADRDQKLLNEAFPKFQTLEFEKTDLETGISGSEGFDGDGGVDARGLNRTLSAFREEIDKSQEGITDVIAYLFSSVRDKSKETERSLIYTYFGLSLIVLGFGLQLIGVIGPSLLTLGEV